MQRIWKCLQRSPLLRASAEPEKKHLVLRAAAAPFTSSAAKNQSTNVRFSPVAPFALIPRVIIYDGVCHLCNAGVRWICRVDKEECISFCSVQSKAAEPYLIACGVSREDVLKRFVFVEGPGLCHSGSTACLKVASYLPLPYSTLSAFLIVPPPLRDAIYDHVANNRYKWFGRSDECIVPSDKILHRFIDREELLELRESRDAAAEEEESTGP